MRELERAYPGARRALFRRYHIGGCASCGFRPEETLGQVLARNGGLPLAEVAAHIVDSHAADLAVLISPEELQRLRSEAKPHRLLDIRTREEFDAVHIEGTVFFSQELMQEILASWNRDELIIFVDHLGVRGMDAAAYFAGHGFSQARVLQGGIDAWSQQVDSALPRYELERAAA